MASLTKTDALDYYRQMISIRSMEGAVWSLFESGHAYGQSHLASGQVGLRCVHTSVGVHRPTSADKSWHTFNTRNDVRRRRPMPNDVSMNAPLVFIGLFITDNLVW